MKKQRNTRSNQRTFWPLDLGLPQCKKITLLLFKWSSLGFFVMDEIGHLTTPRHELSDWWHVYLPKSPGKTIYTTVKGCAQRACRGQRQENHEFKVRWSYIGKILSQKPPTSLKKKGGMTRRRWESHQKQFGKTPKLLESLRKPRASKFPL